MKPSTRILIRALAALVPAITLSNCIIIAKDESPTKGRELIDLKEAQRSGAISQSEYNAQRKHLLEPSGKQPQ